MSKTTEILEKIRQQYQRNQPKPKKDKLTPEQREDFLKKYYNIIKEGEYTFRILPVKEESPFVETYFHHMKVNGKWVKLFCPQKNNTTQCPLCEAEEALKSTGKDEDYQLSRTYQASLFYIVKGIDRDNVEDGPKYWRFKHNYKQNGIFDKLLPVFTKKGDITDPINGRDLTITATRTTGTNNITYVTVSSIMPDDVSRLVEDDTQLKELVNDTTTWKDVYKPKDVEYLQAVVEGKAPYWDENQKKMITPTGQKTVVSKDTDTTTTDTTEATPTNGIDTEEEKGNLFSPSTKTEEPKLDRKIQKQTEDIFETTTTSEEETNDLPF